MPRRKYPPMPATERWPLDSPENLALLERGTDHYWAELQCLNGHNCPRYTKSGACIQCQSIGHRDKELAKTQADYNSSLTGAKRVPIDRSLPLDFDPSRYKPDRQIKWAKRRCLRGHNTPRFANSGGCATCVRAPPGACASWTRAGEGGQKAVVSGSDGGGELDVPSFDRT